MIKKYSMDVYPRALYVAIGETDDAIMEFLKGNTGDKIPSMDEDSNADVLRVSDGEHGGSLIRFKDVTKVTQGIVAHEAFHATMFFCSYLGITFTTEDNEHIAYMLQWIVDKVFETKWELERNA